MAKPDNTPRASAARVAVLVAVATIAFLFFAYAFVDARPFWRIAPEANSNFGLLVLFLEKLVHLQAAALILFAAFSAGLAVLKALGLSELSSIEEIVFASALGLGALSIVTLLLGLCGVLSQPVAVVVLFAFAALGVAHLRGFSRRLRASLGVALSRMEKVLVGAVLLGALLTLVYAFNPPMQFDVLEYHLGAPALYFQSGAIRYIEHNVYSNFPANSEMLHLFSMTLTGSKMTGAIVGKMLNAYIAFLAAGGAFCLGRWLFSRSAGIFAAAALLTSGSFFEVSTAAYVEGLQTLYTLAALVAVGRFLARGTGGWLVVGGLCAGLAAGVKYPAAVFVAAPLCLATLLGRGAAAARMKHAAIFAVAAVAVVAPWLAKNLILTGNPVYPLLYSVFGGRDWSALQDARWAFAHTPKGGLAWEQWCRHILGLFFAEPHVRVSLLSFVFIPLLFAGRALSKRALFTFAYAAVCIFLWFALTHRIARFLVPTLAVTGALSGAGLFSLARSRAKTALSSAAVVLVVFQLFYMGAAYGDTPDPSVPLFGDYGRFLKAKLAGYEALEEVNRLVEDGSRVMLVGEAETFYLDVDYAGTTVFDRKPLEEMAGAAEDAGRIAAAVKSAGCDYIYVNWFTIQRQSSTYAFDFQGTGRDGYSDVIKPGLFREMVRMRTIEPVYSSGREVYPETPSYVLYRIR